MYKKILVTFYSMSFNLTIYLYFQTILERLLINPSLYMKILAKLTEDKSQEDIFDNKIKNINDLEPISVVRTLTEFGICYTTNNYVAANMSTR